MIAESCEDLVMNSRTYPRRGRPIGIVERGIRQRIHEVVARADDKSPGELRAGNDSNDAKLRAWGRILWLELPLLPRSRGRSLLSYHDRQVSKIKRLGIAR